MAEREASTSNSNVLIWQIFIAANDFGTTIWYQQIGELEQIRATVAMRITWHLPLVGWQIHER